MRLWNRPTITGYGEGALYELVNPVATVPVGFQRGAGTEPQICACCYQYQCSQGCEPFFFELQCMLSRMIMSSSGSFLIVHNGSPEEVKGSFSEYCPLVLTLIFLPSALLDSLDIDHMQTSWVFLPRLVGLFNLNKAKSAFWSSLYWE